MAALAAVGFSPATAQSVDDNGAEPCYGLEVLDFLQGPKTNGSPVEADRSNPDVTLGAPSLDNSAGSFFSLGVGGYIEIGFNGIVLDLPGNDIKIVETSFSGNDCGLGDDEFADIELSNDGINWEFYGTICRNEEIDIADVGLDFVTAIRITNSAATSTPDGYDVDGVIALNGCEDFDFFDPNECYAEEALVYEPGTGNIAAVRTDPTQALGEPQRNSASGALNFVSLGFGGTLILGLDGAAQALPDVDDLEVVETTWNNKTCQSYEERADVYVSQQVVEDAAEIDDAQFVYVGQSCTNGALFDVFEETGFSYFTLVKIVDASPVFSNRDGYDVDGIVALNGCDNFPSVTPGDCYAAEAVEYIEGLRKNGNALAANRVDPAEALGAPERTESNVFVTLGYGGSITLAFDGIVPNLAGDDIEVVETSFGNSGCEAYPEYADVYVSQDGSTFHFAKTVCKSDGFVDISDAGPFPYITHVKLVNNDELSTTGDSYDLDGVVALHNCDEEETGGQEGIVAGGLLPGNGGMTLDTYPNPSNGPVYVEFTTDKNTLLTLEVIDMSGRVIETVFRQEADAGQRYRTEFDASGLPNGIYITKLTSDKEIKTGKVMITR